MKDKNKNYCVECGNETQAFYSVSIGWYCGECKNKWENEKKC